MVDQARARRLAKRIATIVATAIEHEIKDTRLTYVTVTDCKVTGDLREATIFYTVRPEKLDEAPDTEGAAEALNKARGKLRTMVGAGTGVRYTPSLAFILDTVPETAKHMEELLAKVRAADEAAARNSEGATHAGDADPYKTIEPRDDE